MATDTLIYTKLNNNILQYYYVECTYNIEPLQINCQILQSSDVLFSKCNQVFNHICIEITFYDKHKN